MSPRSSCLHCQSLNSQQLIQAAYLSLLICLSGILFFVLYTAYFLFLFYFLIVALNTHHVKFTIFKSTTSVIDLTYLVANFQQQTTLLSF